MQRPELNRKGTDEQVPKDAPLEGGEWTGEKKKLLSTDPRHNRTHNIQRKNKKRPSEKALTTMVKSRLNPLRNRKNLRGGKKPAGKLGGKWGQDWDRGSQGKTEKGRTNCKSQTNDGWNDPRLKGKRGNCRTFADEEQNSGNGKKCGPDHNRSTGNA